MEMTETPPMEPMMVINLEEQLVLSGMDTMKMNCIPREGMEFNTDEDAWKFWLDYGKKMGFGCRKQFVNKCRKTNVVTSRMFVCNKEGHRGKDKRDHLTKDGRAETRTNCDARMRVMLNRQTSKYHVYDFVAEHNHDFHLPECVHMMRSQRKITNVQATEVELHYNTGLTQRASHDLFSVQAGGRENLGFTKLDQKNYLRTKRQRTLEYGEVGSLLGYFQNQALEDPCFFYAVQLDKEEQITNIFWADARMRIDYALFGEVITFDTTFSTNREYRPLGVFVGFNHHREMVIFGATLLYDETAESFAWLFDKFLEAHKLKKPVTIFTDQDAAMAKALCQVMPDTRHGLCTWHIMQNGIKHLGNLMKDGSYFLRDFNKLMYEYEDESKFEEAWEAMLSLYKVPDNSWLKGIYKLKEKWGKCYMKNTVTLGMRSTQLSESLNKDLKQYLKSDLDITSFFKHFQRVVDKKRYNEKQAEFDAREKLPRLKVKALPLLQQAGKVYTPLIFDRFQKEWEKSCCTIVKERNENETLRTYLVASYDEKGGYMVTCNLSDQIVSCTCKMFETFGILCSHTLKVLDLNDIKKIPDMYILKRWTRAAREGTSDTSVCFEPRQNASLDVAYRYRELCPELVQLATMASDFEEGHVFMKKVIPKMRKELEDLRRKHYGDGSNMEPHDHLSNLSGSVEEVNSIQNIFANVKGLKKKEGRKRGKRLKGWVEIQGNKKKKKSNLNKELHERANMTTQEPLQKDTETSQSMPWIEYGYDPNQEDIYATSFTQLLHGSLEQNPVPSSSQASNHDHFTGVSHQPTIRELSVVYTPTSFQFEDFSGVSTPTSGEGCSGGAFLNFL